MNIPIRVLSIVDWILEHRNEHCFQYPTEVIIEEICNCSRNMTMAYSTNEKTHLINGVVCGHINKETKEFFVDDILTTERGVVKKFIGVLHKLYPDYIVTGTNRNGRDRMFADTLKLERRLK